MESRAGTAGAVTVADRDSPGLPAGPHLRLQGCKPEPEAHCGRTQNLRPIRTWRSSTQSHTVLPAVLLLEVARPEPLVAGRLPGWVGRLEGRSHDATTL